MSQVLEAKRLKMTQGASSSEESSSEEESDSDDEVVEDSSPSTAGVIERIVLKNFMCHDSFELDLGPQLNFIIGRNGSGKSAILTGISVGLGAKASDTSRGSSIKSLIKDDKSTARVSITLSNRGPDAYNPDEYGSKITIERKIQRQGSNGYSIKSDSGKVISTKKAVLDEILHKFSITVDNPMAFLSQDKAREFLTTATDKSKYNYFMSGSSIEEILDKYNSTSQNIHTVREKLKLTKTHFDVACAKFEEASVIYNQFRRSDNLRKQLHTLHGKIYWFNVNTVEKKIEKYNKKIEQLQEEVAEVDRKEASTEEELTTRSSQRVSLEERVGAAINSVQEYTEKVEEITRKVDEMKDSIKAYQDDINDNKKDIKESEKEIKTLEEQIKLEHERISRQQGGTKDTLASELEDLTKQSKELADKEKNLVHQFEINRSSRKSAKQIEMEEKISNLDETVDSFRRQLLGLRSAQKDKYAPWGHSTHILLKEIRNTTGWHKQPFGPIGAHVSIKKPHAKWHDLLNTVYARTFDSFLVCDEHDRRLLNNILRKTRSNKNIIVRKYESFDYLRGKASGQLTVSDILQVDQQEIFYTLIDVNNVEREVLCDNPEFASQAVGDSRVANAYCLYNSGGANRYSGNRNNLRLDPVIYNRNADKISRGNQVTEADLKDVQDKINSEQTTRHELSRKLRLLKLTEEQERDTQKLELLSQIKTLRIEKKQVESQILKLSDQLKDEGDLGKITAYEERIEEIKKQVHDKQGLIEGVSSELEDLTRSLDQLKQSLKAANENKKKARSYEEAQKKKLEEFDLVGKQLLSDVDHYRASKQKRQKLIEEVEEKKQQKDEQLVDLLALAEAKCTREEAPISPEDTSQSITDEYVTVQKAIEEVEKHMGRSFEDVQQELAATKATKDLLEETLNDLNSMERELDVDLASRFEYMRITINKSINEATSSFEESLALRGFTGELRFGFKEKTLSMLVKTPGDHQMRTVESLSGGEKSFTQIALLLAIWRVMDSRVRGLDEFDVFMDSVNRTISIRLLLSQLRMYPKSQSIFITPQDITSIADLERSDVRIHQMSNPRSE